jgi:hypothetical protein
MRIGPVLHPAVFLAFADRAGFLQYRGTQLRSGRCSSFVVDIESGPAGTNPSALS